MTSLEGTLSSEGGEHAGKAQFDTGNSVHSGIAIFPQVRNKLKESFLKLGGKCHSAGKSLLQVKGVSPPVKLRIPGAKKTLIVKPWVIQNLRDDINIGQKVMEELNITLPYGNENKLTTRTGNTVAMILKQLLKNNKYKDTFPTDVEN